MVLFFLSRTKLNIILCIVILYTDADVYSLVSSVKNKSTQLKSPK